VFLLFKAFVLRNSQFAVRNSIKKELFLRIIGIDPGTIKMGVGVIEVNGKEIKLLSGETVKTHAKKPLPERLKNLYDSLNEVFQIYRPDECSLENVFFSKDPKAAIKIGEARAIAMLVASQFSVPISEYNPTKVKLAVCGNGRAQKHQVQFMIRSLLGLKKNPEPDTADALAIAFCHHHNQGLKNITKLAVGV